MAKKVLMADQDMAFVGMCSMELQGEGFSVVSAYDGDEALAKAIQEKPDIIILDVLLPKKEGPRVLLELKENPSTKKIPVVFFTNLGGRPEDLKAAREIGARDLIPKHSVTPHELGEKIKAIVG